MRDKSFFRSKQGFVGWIYHSQRKSVAVGDWVPVFIILKFDNGSVPEVRQLDFFTGVIKAVLYVVFIFAGDYTGKPHPVPRLECGLVPDYKHVISRIEAGNITVIKVECDAVDKRYVGKVKCVLPDIFQFNIFIVIIVIGGARRRIRRIIHNFGDAKTIQDF